MVDTKAPGVFGFPQMLIAAVVDWCRHVFSPLSVIHEGLKQKLYEDLSVLIGRYWLVPILLTVAADGAVLHFYGIELKSDPVFALLYLAFVGLKVLFEAFLFFAALRMLRVPVTVGMAFVCYSAIVIYSPLFTGLNISQTIRGYDILNLLKSQHLSISETFSYLVHHGKEINESVTQPLPRLAPYFTTASEAIYLFSGACVAECLSQLLKIRRPRAYAATGIASALNAIPIFLVGFSQSAIVFEYLSNSAPQ